MRPPDGNDRSPGCQLTAVALALAASLSWGVGDFIGGLKTRKVGVLSVLLVSQMPTVVVLGAIVALRSTHVAPGRWMIAGALAGVVGLVGLAALYRGMAIGVVSVVAAIAATAPIVPLVIGVLLGERPTVIQFAGMVLALAGVLLLTIDHRQDAVERQVLPGVGLALLAAVAFGFFLVGVRYASRPDPLAGVLAVRVGSVGALAILGLGFHSRVALASSDVPALLTVGFLDTGADVLFALATTIGLLSVVSILSSLYPVATVLLARIVLDERMTRSQLVGILLAFGGVLLISL